MGDIFKAIIIIIGLIILLPLLFVLGLTVYGFITGAGMLFLSNPDGVLYITLIVVIILLVFYIFKN